jgi:hypothetical protein
MPTLASSSAISLARASRPPRVATRPWRSRSSSLSMPRPTMCTVVSRKVTEISTPLR